MTSVHAPRAANALSKLAESESDSDNDEALVRRTNGRLLSRLQQAVTEDSSEGEQGNSDEDTYERTKRRLAAAKSAADSSGEEEEDNGQGAYERMKQLLLASTGAERRLETEPTQDAQKPVAAAAASSSEDADDAPVRGARVRKLQKRREPSESPRVERIRAERLAKRAEEKQRRTKNARQQGEQEPESNSDGEGSRRLTQLAKPTRKAGKKALEAMARDQQRIVRNMQLTHQAKTKKRYGTKDLFAKFGFNQGVEDAESAALPVSENSSVPATSDAEAAPSRDTPPTSPPSFEDASEKDDTLGKPHLTGAADPMEEGAPPAPTKVDKGKGRAPEFQHLPPNQIMQLAQPLIVQNALIEPKEFGSEIMVDLDDSDDEPEVTKPKSRFPIFDNLPVRKDRESSSLLHLRHLAQLSSPGKRGPKGKKTMNMVQLQGSLFQKARQQAQTERQEKIEMLRAKGIIVETEEEKEKRQMEIEDLVAQFEKEKEKDLKLAKREREIAKKNGEIGDGLASSDEEEDEDYVASGEEDEVAENLGDADEVELELSGSEDEEADDEHELDEDEDEDDEGMQEAPEANALIDTMAGEDEDEESANDAPEDGEDDDMLGAEPEEIVRKAPAERTRKVVVDDEDDEESTAQFNGSPTQVATQDETMAAFGFGATAPAIGLTQAFAGTMAILESGSQADRSLTQEPEQDSIDFLRSLPDSQPSFSQRNDIFVPNSQSALFQQDDTQDGSAPPINLGISQLLEETAIYSNTQASEVPEPTQDAGFLISRSPAGLMPSTADTVMVPVPESPIAQRKGKLSRRRKVATVVLSDVDDENVFSASDAEADAGQPATEDAFSFLKNAAKQQKKIDPFNKKTSAAREHLDEQAYESDDEYKGIGGASDEDSGEEDADLAEMIDTSDVKVDERKIAALFADKARKDHDASVAKIYKDLQTGAFRKRGVGDAFDMSDSEDEMEMRRRKKQREFDQMFRALKQDEAVGKMAENPKRKAFFATIMDHSDDSDLEFLDDPEEPAANSASQSDEEKQDKQETQEVSIPDSQTTHAPPNSLKRKSPAADSQEKENRPPPHLRRTAVADAMTRRPISAADIKDSVAELLDDPRDVVPDSQYTSLSDSEDDSSTTPMVRAERVVTNRLSRTPSLATETSTKSNMAFQAPSTAGAGGFRVPSLIRRATSNLSVASERSTSSAGRSSEGGVRMGGTGRSNIHAQAREAERRAVLDKVEGKRKEALKKKVGLARGKRSVLSRLGGGFE
ncbi:uncharacterized protein CC84DRAFT_1226231 [Paraphaeosphaeria sporulosa]|uniref:DNA replication checkpoint mediator MRC1 domain-containing protein n=1 Tax=Paraphaeosphaeria sporulosa TaxID=1460663 RepID=A0A177CYB7_9PLEO|nr:uncharacterized protein CC84DRAFT_1226231 [Paraphaeosphaeria sporulosa]OAG12216.1 hypothetical protein CC84DRAFT_1226231 [Paraphaeosphaeria sporulosa]